MKSSVLMLLGAVSFSAAPVFASGEGTPFFFEFKGDGGAIPNKDSGDGSGHSVFSIVFDQPIEKIISLQVELHGLTHTNPSDLDIYLYNLSNLSNNVEIMTDRGDSEPVEKINLVFDDLITELPSESGALVEGIYGPEGGSLLSLANQGSDVWILLIIDDSPGDVGSLNQWFIRGIGVPEPMSLSLLAVGALAFVRRRFAA